MVSYHQAENLGCGSKPQADSWSDVRPTARGAEQCSLRLMILPLPTCQLRTREGPASKPGERTVFVSSSHPLGAAGAGQPLRMFAGHSLGHTTVKESPS